MFKVIALMTVCIVYGVVSSPAVLFSKPVVVQDIVLDLQPPHLPGVSNLAEKSLAGIESQKPISSPSGSHFQSFTPLPGTRNNAERIQIAPTYFRGTENLAEKAIPADVIIRMSQKHGN